MPPNTSTNVKSDFIKEECLKKPYVHPPEGWYCKKSKGPGPFITKATFLGPEGKLFKWTSREHRKHHFKLDLSFGSTWWAPGSVGWWIGILFAVGSFCFALGSLPSYINFMGNYYDGFTFFIGSIFFTSASFLQYVETSAAPKNLDTNIDEKIKYLIWEPNRIDWWSTLIQFIGTLFFNISTFAALQIYLSITVMNHMVWRPDAYGSICFLLASALAWFEVNHSLWSWKPRNISWSIAASNLLGSIAFGVSAVGSYIPMSTGIPNSVFLNNFGTLIGAVFFFIAAVMLLPERMRVNVISEN